MLESSRSGSMPRLTRPPVPSPAKATQQVDEKNKTELLKSRVLQAAGLKPLFPSQDKRTAYDNFELSARELKQLSQYEISVLIDSSGSMSKTDCISIHSFITPETISRWEWCREQTSMLSEQIAGAFPSGITVIPFANHAERLTNVHPSAIAKIFQTSSPRGSTRLDEALGLELSNYLLQRELGAVKKPLMIAVITDGIPSRPHTVLNGLAAFTRKVNPKEIRIVFFLIGDAPIGSAFSHAVSNLSKYCGASFEIASSRSFKEVCELGLPRSLAQAADALP